MAASEDRYMLIAFAGFCFVLLPGQLLDMGDRVSNPGKGMLFLCYPLWIDCDGGGRVAVLVTNFYSFGIDRSFQRRGKRAES